MFHLLIIINNDPTIVHQLAGDLNDKSIT
jgi:hypothetical protein